MLCTYLHFLIQHRSLLRWTFTDLTGQPYTSANGSINNFVPGKMVWTKASGNDVLAPLFLPSAGQQKVNIYAYHNQDQD